MEFNTIIYEVKDNIATITLNRPDRMNAWTLEMMDEVTIRAVEEQHRTPPQVQPR